MNGLQEAIKKYFPTDQWIHVEHDCVAELVNKAISTINSPIIDIPCCNDIENIAQGICKVLWELRYDETYCKSWDEFTCSDPEDFLQEIADTEMLHQRSDQPVIIVISDNSDVQRENKEKLIQWAQYLRKRNNLKERRLVLILLINACRGFQNSNDIPYPFALLEWPPGDEAQVSSLLDQALNRVLGGRNSQIQTFIKFRASDYCLSFKHDALRIVDFAELTVNSTMDTVNEFESFSWGKLYQTMKNVDPIKLESNSKLMTDFIIRVITQDGKISRRSLSPQEYLFCRELWKKGLANMPIGDSDLIIVSPRGIEFLREAIQGLGYGTKDEKRIVIQRCRDSVSDYVLSKCLNFERILKRQATYRCIQSEKLQLKLRSLLSRQWQSAGTYRSQIINSLPVDSVTDDDIQLLQLSSLHIFLQLYRELFDLQDKRFVESSKKFVEIRNMLAHGQNSSWAMFNDILRLERQLVLLGIL